MGVRFFDLENGQGTKGLNLATFKSNRISGMSEACVGTAPNEIGNYVWEDTNLNGIQDAGEPGIEGVNVELYFTDGTLVASTLTDVDGEYYFSHHDSLSQTWVSPTDSIRPNTTYYVVVGNSQFAADELSVGGNTYTLTIDSVNTGANSEIRASDGEVLATSPSDAFDGLVATMVTTGNLGSVDHSIDFGFYPPTECQLQIVDVLTTNCTGTGPFTSDLNVELSWSNAPAGEAIQVTLDGGSTQTIAAGAASPQTLSLIHI